MSSTDPPDHGHRHEHTHAPDAAPAPAHHGPEREPAYPPDAEAHRTPLDEGAGRGKILFFDAFSGVAGDMTIAALVDLGVPFSVVQQAVARLPIAGFRLVLRPTLAGAIGACKFDVEIDAPSRERTYAEIDRMLQQGELPQHTRELARRIFHCLARAEAEVHRTPIETVHFHELGAIDAIVDIVGTAACLAYLGASVVASPLPMGRGSVLSRHGVLPLPPPAVVACAKGVPTYDAGIDVELVTPTGAAIVATVAQSFTRWPDFAPLRIGWGRGTQSLEDRPNVLRVVLGDATPAAASDAATHVIVEANVDDLTGELAGHAIETLLATGALDAWAVPVTMKKGRPGWTLCALSPRERADMLVDVMLRETSTIGVRLVGAARRERPRRAIEVDTVYGKIPVKISEGPWGAAQVKPEFDACVRAARSAGVSVREVIAEVLKRASL